MEIPTDWTFKSAGVAEGFERHVREQLPWYELATGAIAHIARHYIPENGLVYDVGASTGNVGRALAETLEKRKAKLVAIDNSAEMAALYTGPGKIEIADALDYDFEPYDVAVCFLVLMFMPPAHRRAWLRRVVAQMRPGGALIVFDKIASPTGYLSTVLHRLTIAGKVATGCDPREIIAKELSLCGVQRPIEESLMSFSAPNATKVFQFGEFAGWVIERPE